MNKLAVLTCILLLGGLAAAQAPTSGNVFVGYSYENIDLFNTGRSNFNGWQASVEGKVIPGIGIVADFGDHYGSGTSVVVGGGATCPINGCPSINGHAHIFEAMFGPRFSVSLGRYRPFAEIELGVAHLSSNVLVSGNSFAGALGGGLDYRVLRPVALRVQADYVWTHFISPYQSTIRVATGVVIRF